MFNESLADLSLGQRLFLRMTPDFIAYFLPGFHPSLKDDRHLVSSQALQALPVTLQTNTGTAP